MKLTKEQKFLYSRVGILVASVGWIASAFAGLKGFAFWYGSFVLFFWVAFGLVNYRKKSSLFLLLNQPFPFLIFFSCLAALSFLADQYGLNMNLWFYPFYTGWGFLWVYLVLYPFGALSVLELIYFLAGTFGEDLRFQERPMTKWHGFFDVVETLLLLAFSALVIQGATRVGWNADFPFITLVGVAWLLAALIKLRFHLRHGGHYLLVLSAGMVLALFLHELPNTVAREWVYLEAPFLNFALFGLPLWVWLGWYFLTLIPLRLWITLVLHPKVK